ncbi:MAG: nitroreductase family protein [Anaerolineae bacterium]
MDAYAVLCARRSIRNYQERPIPPELLRALLKAAMAAPSAANSQPWEFVVLTLPETLARLRERLLFARYNAPAAIVVCGNPDIANNSAARQYWVEDCSAATENILIAAAALGLGAVWIGVYPLPGVIKPVREILGLPEHVTPLSLVYVGYPAEERPPSERYDEKRVYWEEYEPRKRRARLKNAKHET